MNHIIIKHQSDFKTIINAPILLTGNKDLEQEEIYENMWAMSLTQKVLKKLTLQDIETFFNELIIKRKQQIHDSGYSAVFYAWFDEMAAQLCFNILSDSEHVLPFGGKLETLNSPHTIVEEFFHSKYHGGIPWSEIEIIDRSDPRWDGDYEDVNESHVLKVFFDRVRFASLSS